jgi:NDP-sugar pyrophosphorylase family protein
LLPIRGKPILEHNIELCARHGITRLFINLHHRPMMIRRRLGDGSRWGVSIRYKFEPELLGTAGGVKNFESWLGPDPFFVIYGDNWIDYDLTFMLARHAAAKADMSVAVFPMPDARQSGVVLMTRSGRIREFVEKPASKRPRRGWVNMGVYVMEPRLLAGIPPGASDFGRDVIPRFLKDGLKVMAVKMPRIVRYIDTPELYEKWRGR